MSYDEHLISQAGGDGDKLDLDAIQARADAATRGPWEIKTEDRDTPSVWHDQEVAFSIGRCADCGVEAEYETADAEFISEARTDVPALLAYARHMEGKLGRVEALCVEWDAVVDVFPLTPAALFAGSHAKRVRAALTATEGAE